MAVIVTATFGLVIWIILWALNVSGFDGLLLAVGLVLIALALRTITQQQRDR
jgi:hypothetical protein